MKDCSEATLFDVWRRVERKGSRGGIDRVTLAELGKRLDDNLAQLRADLLGGRYVPEPFQKIEVPKFDSPGERRPLQLPTVRDKIAQGSVISPLLSNVYLTPFDAYLTQKKVAVARYSDNYILLAPGSRKVMQALDKSRSFLERRLKLTLNPHPRPVASLESGFVFLGIYFHGKTRRVAHAKVDQMKAEIRGFWHRRSTVETPKLLEKLNESILGWKRYYGMIRPEEQFQERYFHPHPNPQCW